jgi:hypothetical protein
VRHVGQGPVPVGHGPAAVVVRGDHGQRRARQALAPVALPPHDDAARRLCRGAAAPRAGGVAVRPLQAQRRRAERVHARAQDARRLLHVRPHHPAPAIGRHLRLQHVKGVGRRRAIGAAPGRNHPEGHAQLVQPPGHGLHAGLYAAVRVQRKLLPQLIAHEHNVQAQARQQRHPAPAVRQQGVAKAGRAAGGGRRGGCSGRAGGQRGAQLLLQGRERRQRRQRRAIVERVGQESKEGQAPEAGAGGAHSVQAQRNAVGLCTKLATKCQWLFLRARRVHPAKQRR